MLPPKEEFDIEAPIIAKMILDGKLSEAQSAFESFCARADNIKNYEISILISRIKAQARRMQTQQEITNTLAD
jgi:hypothetical protein